METLKRLNLTDLITALQAYAHTARRLAKAHRRSRVRSRPPHTQRLRMYENIELKVGNNCN